MTGRMQQRARQRGFSGAEVAVQINYQAWHQHARQRGTQGSGAGFIVQVSFKMPHLVK
jgi:hypothetical protein